jgi:hypothetical protein
MMPNKPHQSQSQSQSQPKQNQGKMPPRRVYSREFKLETLRLLKSSSKTKADLERELGVYHGQIHRGVVQSPAAPFSARLLQPRNFRTEIFRIESRVN